MFLANGRRLPEISKMRGKPFPNDHLDQFFNAAVDAGIVLASFIRAADAVGLGTCPISVIRDHSAKVSEMLELPQRVIPVAGMCVGWPSEAGHISARLGAVSTVHDGKYDEGDLAARIDAYDRRRAAIHPYKPRDPARWGDVPFYGWSEDKARQYGVPQRADFGAFVREKGFFRAATRTSQRPAVGSPGCAPRTAPDRRASSSARSSAGCAGTHVTPNSARFTYFCTRQFSVSATNTSPRGLTAM